MTYGFMSLSFVHMLTLAFRIGVCEFSLCGCVLVEKISFIYENHIPPLFLLRSYMMCARASGGGEKGLRFLCMWIYHKHTYTYPCCSLFVINTCVLVTQLDHFSRAPKNVFSAFLFAPPTAIIHVYIHTIFFLGNVGYFCVCMCKREFIINFFLLPFVKTTCNPFCFRLRRDCCWCRCW